MKNIVVSGTIGKDAVLRRTQNGDPITGFSVAVDDGWGDSKTTMWFDVSLFGKRGQNLEPHLKKGSKVSVSGELSRREHEGKTYLTIRADNITLMGGSQAKQDDYQRPTQEPASQAVYDDDPLPF